MIHDEVRVIWLMLRVAARIIRVKFPCRRLTFAKHKHRGLEEWREMRDLFRKHGYDLHSPPFAHLPDHVARETHD